MTELTPEELDRMEGWANTADPDDGYAVSVHKDDLLALIAAARERDEKWLRRPGTDGVGDRGWTWEREAARLESALDGMRERAEAAEARAEEYFALLVEVEHRATEAGMVPDMCIAATDFGGAIERIRTAINKTRGGSQ